MQRLTDSPKRPTPISKASRREKCTGGLKTGLRESRVAAARQVLVVPALFRVANCCCRGRNHQIANHYTDDKGVRLEPESLRQRRPNGSGGWIRNLDHTCRVPYRWQELPKYPGACVFVCEGEKDADRVASLDGCATTAASGKWTDDCVNALARRDVLILEDDDEAGCRKRLTPRRRCTAQQRRSALCGCRTCPRRAI